MLSTTAQMKIPLKNLAHMNLIAKAPHNVQSHYMVQLDALRAFAVLGVLVHHFLPQEFFLNSKSTLR